METRRICSWKWRPVRCLRLCSAGKQHEFPHPKRDWTVGAPLPFHDCVFKRFYPHTRKKHAKNSRVLSRGKLSDFRPNGPLPTKSKISGNENKQIRFFFFQPPAIKAKPNNSLAEIFLGLDNDHNHRGSCASYQLIFVECTSKTKWTK